MPESCAGKDCRTAPTMGGQCEARVCNDGRAARWNTLGQTLGRVLARRNGTAQAAHRADLLGKTSCHYINLYWAGHQKTGAIRRKRDAKPAQMRADATSLATSLALWGKPRNSIAFDRPKNVSRWQDELSHPAADRAAGTCAIVGRCGGIGDRDSGAASGP